MSANRYELDRFLACCSGPELLLFRDYGGEIDRRVVIATAWRDARAYGVGFVRRWLEQVTGDVLPADDAARLLARLKIDYPDRPPPAEEPLPRSVLREQVRKEKSATRPRKARRAVAAEAA